MEGRRLGARQADSRRSRDDATRETTGREPIAESEAAGDRALRSTRDRRSHSGSTLARQGEPVTVRHACMGTRAHTPVAVGAAAGYQSGRFAKGDAIAATDSARLVSVHPAVAPVHVRGSCNGPCSSRQMPTPAARVEVSGQSKLTPPHALLWMTDTWDRVIPSCPYNGRPEGRPQPRTHGARPLFLVSSRADRPVTHSSSGGNRREDATPPARQAFTLRSHDTPPGGPLIVRKTGWGRGVHTPGALGAAAGHRSGLFARSR